MLEESQRVVVADGDNHIDLMKMERAAGIVVNLQDGGGGIALMTTGTQDDKSQLGLHVLGVERHQIGKTNGLVRLVLDDQSHLLVGIDVACGTGEELVEQKFAEANTGSEADALFEEAVYKMKRGSYEEAIGLFDQCLEAEEPSEGAYYNRGLCYMTMGDNESAIKDFAESVEKEESFAKEALYTKATCEMTILAYDDAVADFTACIEQEADPDNSRINRGICLLLSGKAPGC